MGGFDGLGDTGDDRAGEDGRDVWTACGLVVRRIKVEICI